MNQIPFTLFINIEQDSSFHSGGNRAGAFRCYWLWLLSRWMLLRERDIVDAGILVYKGQAGINVPVLSQNLFRHMNCVRRVSLPHSHISLFLLARLHT